MMKRVAILAAWTLIACAIFAAGFVIGSVTDRSKSTKGWRDDALRATVRAVHLEGESGRESPIFFYIVENNTDQDYSATEADVQMLVRDEGALDASWMRGVSIDTPIFIPSGDKATVTVHFRMIEKAQPKSQAPEDIQTFIRDPERIWHSFDGFVLLDKKNRYRVTFPLPWRSTRSAV